MKNLYIVLFLLLSAGCTLSEAKKEEIKADCESSPEFKVRTISFVGFDFTDVEKIKIVERDSNQVIAETLVDLNSTNYEFRVYKYAYYDVSIPIDVYSAQSTYDFVMADQSVYRLHRMKQTTYRTPSKDAQGYGCRMTAYYVNDREFYDMHGILIIKEVGN